MAENPTLEEKYPDMFREDAYQDPRLRIRERPMEVLNLSFPRTGTASVQQALNILDIPCWHGFYLFSNIRDAEMITSALDAKFFGRGEQFQRADWDQLFGKYAAVSDVPVVCFAQELIEAYPEAKVILVERELEDWYESFNNAVVASLFNPTIMFISKYDKYYLGPLREMTSHWVNGWMKAYSKEEMRQNARRTYLDHNKLIRKVTPQERLLEYKLGSGWGPLCEFLGKPIPDVPFPATNDRVALHEKFDIAIRKSIKNVVGRAVLVMVPCLCLIVAGWVYKSPIGR